MATPGTPPTPTVERAVPVPPSAPATTDWPKQATDQIVKVVDTVRDKTAGPAVTAARAVVYGTILVILAIPLFVLALVGAMRGFERLFIIIGEWLQWEFLYQPMYLVYALFGAVFFLVGLRLWAKAKRPAPVTA